MHESDWIQEEEAWVVLAREGDLAAFDRLAGRYRAAAIVMAGRTMPKEMAEDVAQDSLIAAFKALPRLESPDKFASWFGAIVRNRAKRTARQTPMAAPLDELIAAYAPSILAQILDDERSRAVRCAIQALQPEVRDVVELYYLHEWPVKRISEFFLLPQTTVKWRLHTGREQLRRRLSRSLEEYDGNE